MTLKVKYLQESWAKRWIPKTRETGQISLDMTYQEDIANYIKISIELKQNLCKSYKVIQEFCNKQIQLLTETNVEYEMKIH